jgi:hypothetical protein
LDFASSRIYKLDLRIWHGWIDLDIESFAARPRAINLYSLTRFPVAIRPLPRLLTPALTAVHLPFAKAKVSSLSTFMAGLRFTALNEARPVILRGTLNGFIRDPSGVLIAQWTRQPLHPLLLAHRFQELRSFQ